MSTPSAGVISAFAALASAFAAYASYRVATKTFNSTVSPLIIGDYVFDKEFIKLTNIGKGPAVNLRLQKTNRHYIDLGLIVEFELEQTHLTLMPGETLDVSIRKKGSKNTTSINRKFTNFSFIDMVSQKEMGIIYDDMYGKSWISKLDYSDDRGRNQSIKIKKVKSYTIAYGFWDSIDTIRFKLLKRVREKKSKDNIEA